MLTIDQKILRKGKGKGKGKSEPEKPYLLVDPDLGAGVELTPTCWGMHVDLVEDKPGQPHLTAGCTITAIDGHNLLGLANEESLVGGEVGSISLCWPRVSLCWFPLEVNDCLCISMIEMREKHKVQSHCAFWREHF